MKVQRRRLPDERRGITHRFTINSAELGPVDCYVTVNVYPEDGDPGELFIKIAKEGSSLGVLMDQLAMATSIGLQSGVPLSTFITKFKWVSFDPEGLTGSQEIPIVKSPLDYIARWLELRFARFIERETEKVDEVEVRGTSEDLG
jgi:ribonucleoside-diphosphate reductase alpha chain